MRYALMLTGVLAAALLSAACEPDRPDDKEGEVLAWVGETSITERDLEVAMEQMFGARQAAEADVETRERVLDSLVESRALAELARQRLPAEEAESRVIRARLREDELLVQAWLRHYAEPLPVTEDMMREYYARNPERFGAGEDRNYELLLVTRDLSQRERREVLAGFRDAASADDWRAVAAELSAANLPVARHVGSLDESVLPERLRSGLSVLGEGEVSETLLHEGRVYLGRVRGIRERRPQPYSEVREDIHQRLFSVRVQEALSGATSEARKEIEIRYRDREKDEQ